MSGPVLLVSWRRVLASDPIARELRDRHYSTKHPGGRTVGPPGRRLVLIYGERDALWITHYPAADLVLDRIDALRCTIFRRELGDRPASELALEAMAISEAVYGPAAMGWITYVEPGAVASEVAGYTFRRAGFRRDRAWRHPRLIRLRRASLADRPARSSSVAPVAQLDGHEVQQDRGTARED